MKKVTLKDVILELDNNPSKERFGYLCIFEITGWIPIFWGEIFDNKIIFKDMAMDILYLPAYYIEKKIPMDLADTPSMRVLYHGMRFI